MTQPGTRRFPPLCIPWGENRSDLGGVTLRLRVLNGTAQEEALIRQAAEVALVKAQDGLCGLPGLEQLRGCMMARLNGVRPLTVRVSDCVGVATEAFSFRGLGVMGICRSSLAEGPVRLSSIFFHELVHTCGGEELDAEGLEGHCFREGGATFPSDDDFRQFRQSPMEEGYVAGRFLLWDPKTGSLFVKGEGGKPGAQLRAGFRDPQRPSRS